MKDKDVLLHALSERYGSLHRIRNRIQSISLWSLGLMLTAGGFLIQADLNLEPDKKLLAAGALIVATILLSFYINDLEKGFKAQQKVAVVLEGLLGMYTPGFFDSSINDSVYPKEWKNAGSVNGKGEYFKWSFILIFAGALFLLIIIILTDTSYICFRK